MTDNLKLEPKEFYFLPMGGSEQFGVNFNLYAYEGKWLAVDCGIGFADWRLPGIDIMLPDPSFLEKRKKNLAGMIITHAHEDHIGAVPHLWPRLRCPIYCTPFTAAVLEKKFSEFPACRDAEITIIEPGVAEKIGPFSIDFLPVAHSIPDAVSLLITTKVGTIVHSGDWNLDPKPPVGWKTDEKAFKAAGKSGVMAYIGDSTNAEVPGHAISESDVQKGMAEVIKGCEARVAVTMFASNVGRIHSIAKAAEACGRRVAVAGRSMINMIAAARRCGYLDDVAPFVDLEDAMAFPEDKILYIVTGSQGEGRAALSKIARGEYRDIRLSAGDTVIFSSRKIPGNERDIIDVKNHLVASGIKVITPGNTKARIHVSGHPYRDEIKDMFSWVKPESVIAVHGEISMLKAQEEIARSQGVKNVIVPHNGSVIRLAPGKTEIVDHVTSGVLAVEPKRILPVDHAGIVERRKLQFTGAVHVSLVLNESGALLDDPQMTIIGLSDESYPGDQALEDELYDEIEDILEDMEKVDRRDDHAVHEEVRIGVRRLVHVLFGMKANVTVHVMRVED